MDVVVRSLHQGAGGNYYTAILCWKVPSRRPWSNFPEAKLRFQQLARPFQFNPNLRRAYGSVVDDWQKKVYVERLDLDHDEDQYFVPQFPVLQLDTAGGGAERRLAQDVTDASKIKEMAVSHHH